MRTMKLHIVTVALNDSEDLAETSRSCQIESRLAFDAVHWIFAKHDHLAIQARFPNAKVLESKDSGIYNAMNLAFDRLNSELHDDDVLLFLNAGDRLDPSELAKHIERHIQASADVSVASVKLMRNGQVVGIVSSPTVPSSLGDIIFRNYPCHQSTFYSARFLKRIRERRGKLYLEDFRVCADLELYLQAQQNTVVTTDRCTGAYDIDGFSSRQSMAVAAEKARLTRLYHVGIGWRIYSVYWSLKARLVGPKRYLLAMVRSGS